MPRRPAEPPASCFAPAPGQRPRQRRQATAIRSALCRPARPRCLRPNAFRCVQRCDDTGRREQPSLSFRLTLAAEYLGRGPPLSQWNEHQVKLRTQERTGVRRLPLVRIPTAQFKSRCLFPVLWGEKQPAPQKQELTDDHRASGEAREILAQTQQGPKS